MTQPENQQEEEIELRYPLPIPPYMSTLADYIKQLEESQKAMYHAATLFREQQRFYSEEIMCMIDRVRMSQNTITLFLTWIDERESQRYFNTFISTPLSPPVGIRLILTHLNEEETLRLLLHLDTFKDICQSNTTERINKHIALRRELVSYHKQLQQLIEECMQLAQIIIHGYQQAKEE